jgi:hypothetical protein
MGRIYEACLKMASCGVMYTSSFMKTGSGIQAMLTFASEIQEAVMLVLLIRGIYEEWRSVGIILHGVTRFHEDWYRGSISINVLSQQFERI